MPDAAVRTKSVVATGVSRQSPALLVSDGSAASAPRLPPLLSSGDILELSRLEAVVSLQRWWKHRRRRNHRRVAELSEQLRVYAESLIHKKRQARIRAKIRDIVVHIVFLVAYTLSCHHGYTNEHLFRLVHATTSAYSASTFETIASHSDLFAWLRGPFLSATYTSSTASSSGPQLTNRVVGAVRIGQLRVPRHVCTQRVSAYAPAALTDATNTGHELDCYGLALGDFDADDELTDAFGGSSGSEFTFEGLNGTSTTTERSEFLSSMNAPNAKTLPAPAFSVLLPRADSDQAAQILQYLENSDYVDLHTRAVVVDVNFFNAMLQYTMAVRFLVEFPSAGGAVATLYVSTAPLTSSFLIDEDAVAWTLSNFAVLGFYAYFLVSEIALQSTRRRRRRALPATSDRALRWSRRNGSLLRVLSLATYFAVWLLRLFTLLKAPSAFPLFASPSYVRLRPFAEAFRLSQALLGVNTCLCWWILLLLLRVVTHIDVFVRTVEFAAARLATLLVCLTILLYGYASAFLVVAGAESAGFRSIARAMATLLLLLFGSSDAAATSHYSTVEMVLFACFLLLNVFVVSNLFLAVVYDSYRQALDHAEQLRTASDQFNLPLETLNYCRAGVDNISNRVMSLARRIVPARKTPIRERLKRLSVVHAVSNSNVVAKSTRLFAGKAGELSRFGDKLVQNVAAGLGNGDRELLIERGPTIPGTGSRNSSSLSRRRGLEPSAVSDQTMKLLQGMLLQLAIQNETLQRSVDDLSRELKQQLTSRAGTAGDNIIDPSISRPGAGTERKTSRTGSNTHGRLFALNRPDSENGNNDEDDDDDDDDMGEEVQVVDLPAELTTIQSI